MPSWRGPETYWGTEWESLEKANVIQKLIVKKIKICIYLTMQTKQTTTFALWHSKKCTKDITDHRLSACQQHTQYKEEYCVRAGFHCSI